MEGYIPCNMSEISEDDKDSYECPICFYKIDTDSPYSMINNPREKGKFHIECLEKWLQVSNNGLFTQDKIKKYSNYQCKKKLESIKVPQNRYPNKNEENNTTNNDQNPKGCCIIL